MEVAGRGLADVTHVIRLPGQSAGCRRVRMISPLLLQHKVHVPCSTHMGFSLTSENYTHGALVFLPNHEPPKSMHHPLSVGIPTVSMPDMEQACGKCSRISGTSKQHRKPASCLLSPRSVLFLLLPKTLPVAQQLQRLFRRWKDS